ncbi:hypothetical protein [Virgibacillus kimchii]
MKFLTKLLAFIFLLFGSIVLVNQGASANQIDSNGVELQSTNSIVEYAHIDHPVRDWERGLVTFPDQIWRTVGNYGGYLYLQSFEELPGAILKTNYRGTLYLHAVPPRELDPEEEQ